MATVRVDGETLVVELSVLDKLLAVHGSFRIPLASVVRASAEKPPSFWSALKLMGTGSLWPMKLAGSFVYHGNMVFFDYQRDDAILAIELVPGSSAYAQLFVHVDEPDSPQAAAARIAAALPQAASAAT